MLEASQRIDDFEIIRPLGKGGMGEVYEAQQLNPSRRVALKVLAPWLTQDEDSLNRFRREVEVLAQLDHPGIVNVISTDRTPEGIFFYTMKLIRGISLSELMRTASQAQGDTRVAPTKSQHANEQETPSSGGPVEPFRAPDSAAGSPIEIVREYVANRHEFVVRVGINAARALGAAHQQGHLHRDIKPSNLMIDHHGQLYLVDFGLTRALDPGANVSRDGYARGTPWYMSPEQARGESIDQRSDVYSLGVTLFELITGGMGPYTASRDDSVAVLAQVRGGMHLPLRVLAPSIPRELEQIILRAIQLKRKRRYQHAADLAADLERLMPSGSGLLTPSKRKPVAGRTSVKSWIVPTAAAALLFVALGFAWRAWWAVPSNTSIRPTGDDANTGAITTTKPTIEEHDRPVRDDYPAGLRNPPPRTIVQLLTTDNQPVWPNQRLLGDGFLSELPRELILTSTDSGTATMIALGDSTRTDPDRPWFEFTIELRQHATRNQPEVVQVGVFWGQRDTEVGIQCYTAQLETQPVQKNPHGRLRIGWSLMRSANASTGRTGVSSWMRPMPQGKGLLPLPESNRDSTGWRKVRVSVLEQEISVTVDDDASTDFSSRVFKSDPLLKDGTLDPRGQFGIWVRNGQGSFRNATYLPVGK